VAKTVRIKPSAQAAARGAKPITMQKGALHEQLGVPASQKIPASKMAAARAGRYGPKAKARANFAKHVLTG
jgi:hypothetical protein